MKCLDNGMTSLDEINGTKISDIFNSDASTVNFPDNTSMKLQDNMFAEASTDCQQIDFETIFDVSEKCVWPFNEVTDGIVTEPFQDFGLIEEASLNFNDAWLYFAIQQIWPLDQSVINTFGITGFTDEEECYNPYLCLTTSPNILDIVPPDWPVLLPWEPQKKLPITLVLDLDETLVHSTMDTCEDADFSFPVHSRSQVHTVYVRQRPHLRMFLEAVAGMFEIIIFTAGQSIYAERLLDILDPDHSLIGQRIYRDSCVLSENGYMKDLTILGRDLARIAIVDNSPQVFQLQIDNGIPIQSWFGDRSDNALVSLLLFLETLVGAEDVRPIIKEKFGSQEKNSMVI